MAALNSIQFVQFAIPPSKPSFCNRNAPWSSKPSRSNRSLNASYSQKARRPAATLSREGCEIEAGRNTIARAKEHKRALTDHDDESDDDSPSLGELSRAALRSKIATKALKTASTPRLEQPAHHRTGPQVDRIQSGRGERQDGSRDLPVIVDEDDPVEAGAENGVEAVCGDDNTGHIALDTSLHDTAISELLAPAESIDASGSWYDVEDGCFIEEPAQRVGSHEQYSVPSAPAQAQLQILPQSSKALQDQIGPPGLSEITERTPMESTLSSLPQSSNSGDHGWTHENMAELEEELGLALGEQQVESSSAGTPASPSFRSAEAQDDTQNPQQSETTGGRPEELHDAPRRGTPALELWEKQETQVVPAVIDQQDLAEVVDADDPGDEEATEALLAAQPKITETDEHRFRLRGVRARQLAGRQTKTTQYRVVWGKHPNRSDSWFNEDDVQISMPCEQHSQDLALQVDLVRVCDIRSSLYKGRKVFEYLVDMSGHDSRTWTTEDQLGISLSPMLAVELKASSHPLTQAQRDVLLRHSATPMREEHCHAQRASRSSSAPADPALEDVHVTRKRGHQEAHTEISSENHHCTNSDDNHNADNTSDEDPRPAKRRKPHSVRVVAPTTSYTYTPELHLGQPRTPLTQSTDTPDIDDQDGCSVTFVDNSCHHSSRTSRSPSVASVVVPVAEYQEWPFQGFLKRVKIGDDVTFNLEFKLPSTLEHLRLPNDPQALDICSGREAPAKVLTHHESANRSKVHQAPLEGKKQRAKRIKWTTEEDATVLRMRNDGCSWEAIHAALPHRSIGTIQVHYSTKLKG